MPVILPEDDFSRLFWYFAQRTGWSAMSFVVLQKDRKNRFFHLSLNLEKCNMEEYWLWKAKQTIFKVQGIKGPENRNERKTYVLDVLAKIDMKFW